MYHLFLEPLQVEIKSYTSLIIYIKNENLIYKHDIYIC